MPLSQVNSVQGYSFYSSITMLLFFLFFVFFLNFFLWTKVHFVEPLIAPVLDFVCPSITIFIIVVVVVGNALPCSLLLLLWGMCHGVSCGGGRQRQGRTVVDLRRGRPHRPKFLHFYAVFGKHLSSNRLVPPGVGAHSLGNPGSATAEVSQTCPAIQYNKKLRFPWGTGGLPKERQT